ncbi:hypothetical protein Tco_1437043 [Tanacetum coccineum]
MPKGPLQLVDEFVDEGVPEKEPFYVVFREPDSGIFQPLPERRTPMPPEPSRIADSPSLDADLAPTDSEMEFDEEVPGINAGDQDEGQAGPQPGGLTSIKYAVHVDQNFEHNDLEGHDASTQQNTNQMDEEFTTTAYPNVQENLKLPTEDQFLEEKSQEDEPEKTNNELEVQQMVTVPIHQDTSSVPPMATLVIDLTISHPVSTTVHAPLPTSTTTTTTIITTTSLPPPPPQPQQSSSYPILLQRIRELEQHIADLIQKKTLAKNLWRKHGDWPMQAPLRARFSDLPAVNMKEVLQQWMFKDKSYLAHEDHKNLFEALEKSLERNDHLPNADIRKGWWKPLPEEERPATPEPAWTIPSSNISDVENNWASALVSTYEPPAENSLLAKIGDMTTFMNWYYSKVNKIVLTQVDFEGQAYETNPEGDQVRIDVSRPLPFGGPPDHLTIQTEFFFNKDLEYLRYGNKGSRPALSISKMKAARYPDFGLELLVPEQMWIDEVCTYDISAAYAYSRYGYDYLSEIVLRRADFQEYKIAEKDFKNLYPSEFEDLNLLLLQGHLDHPSGSDTAHRAIEDEKDLPELRMLYW